MEKLKKTWKGVPVWVIALALIAVFVSVYAAVQFAPRYVYVTVEEAISITPESIPVKLYVGESGTANFTITNSANVEIPLTVVAKVTEYPEGGNATDLTLTYPETIKANPGNTTLTIRFSLATGAVPGKYTITVTVTRV